MGKKARKTRWRTLTLTDELSDSETSSTTTQPAFKSQKFPSNRYTHSGQSTLRRKYQYDGPKSARSSSTTTENKMAFNEDDYTKISTPRQDVLFKKGYLNKPKNFSTQTSTGASTISTGNSTGNGTPDYQSTDLEYESQFVFPNGFVDHNGYYYVNGYDYPYMFYNVPTYYPEYTNYRSKRNSSGSLTESTSPNNEEVTSQDFSSTEASNKQSDYTGHYRAQNHFSHNPNCPTYYQNATSLPNGVVSGEGPLDQSRKNKKLRRRTVSQLEDHDSTENSDGGTNSEEQERTTTLSADADSKKHVHEKLIVKESEDNAKISNEDIQEEKLPHNEHIEESEDQSPNPQHDLANVESEGTSSLIDSENSQNPPSNHKENTDPSQLSEESQLLIPSITSDQDKSDHTKREEPTSEQKLEPSQKEQKLDSHLSTDFAITSNTTNESIEEPNNIEDTTSVSQEQKPNITKYDLKPDAEEFIPRSYHTHDFSINPVQFINISGNCMPIPVFPFNGQTFNPAFIPPGFPLNFIPPDPKMFPNFVGLPPGGLIYNGHVDVYNQEHDLNQNSNPSNKNCDSSNTAKDQKSESESTDKNKLANKTIDIATVVSKLEVAAKEQEEKENNALNKNISEETTETGYKTHSRIKNNISNYKNRSQNSPQRDLRYRKADLGYRNSSTSNNGETNRVDFKTVDTLQNLEPNGTSTSSYKPNYPPASQSNSPAKQLRQTNPNSQSPLRKNNEHFRTSPYRQNGSNSSTAKFTMPVNNGTASPLTLTKISSGSTSGRSSEKINKNWKQTNRTNNKTKQYHEKPDTRERVAENVVTENGITHDIKTSSGDPKLCAITKNSSQTNEDITNKVIKTELSNLPQENLNTLPRTPNQWISVQKRKKRKNKNVEEVENFTDEEIDDSQNDQFESYDVNQLTDVVIPSKNETVMPTTNNTEDNKKENEGVEAVSVITKDEIPIVEEEKSKETSEVSINNIVELQQVDNDVQSLVNEVQTEDRNTTEERFTALSKDESEITTRKDKKKLKKNTQKPNKKKVIVKDLDLSDQYTEIREPVKMIVKKVGRITVSATSSAPLPPPAPLPSTSQKNEANDDKISEIIETFEKEPSTESIVSSELDDKKKSKKKRKKQSKANNNNASFNPDSIVGAMEDTFDFLNSALTNEAEGKTNDEISEELDKIIQKGMLNSIEEKIKSFNIDESDGFFNSVWTKLSRKETGMGYTKIPDFTEILKPSSKSQLNTPLSWRF